jgi:hypothetical protein
MKKKKCKLCEEQNNRLRSEFCSEYCKTKYWRIVNAEYNQQFNKQYYEQHKDHYSEMNKEKYRSNKSLYNTRTKAYAKANPDKRCALVSKYNATKLKATPKWLTKEHLKEIEVFYIKAKELEEIDNIKRHVDHIVPLQGEIVSGLHVPWNLRVITAEENLKKGNKLIENL